MSLEVRPATATRFDELATMLRPALLHGAVAYARANGAPPVRGGQRWTARRPYDGLRRNRGLFERVGFAKAADTTSVSGGFPRVLMRLDLR